MCPIQCGGAASHSRLRRTILHNESADCKRLCDNSVPTLRGSGQTRFLGHSQVRQVERKEEMKAYPSDTERFILDDLTERLAGIKGHLVRLLFRRRGADLESQRRWHY